MRPTGCVQCVRVARRRGSRADEQYKCIKGENAPIPMKHIQEGRYIEPYHSHKYGELVFVQNYMGMCRGDEKPFHIPHLSSSEDMWRHTYATIDGVSDWALTQYHIAHVGWLRDKSLAKRTNDWVDGYFRSLNEREKELLEAKVIKPFILVELMPEDLQNRIKSAWTYAERKRSSKGFVKDNGYDDPEGEKEMQQRYLLGDYRTYLGRPWPRTAKRWREEE